MWILHMCMYVNVLSLSDKTIFSELFAFLFCFLEKLKKVGKNQQQQKKKRIKLNKNLELLPKAENVARQHVFFPSQFLSQRFLPLHVLLDCTQLAVEPAHEHRVMKIIVKHADGNPHLF